MNFLNELLGAYDSGQLQLGTLLAVLGSRGPQPDAVHREELMLVERLAAEGKLPDDAVAALLDVLREQQAAGAAPPAGDRDPDATRLAVPRAGAPDDPTRIARPSADPDATRVQPAAAPPVASDADADATVVQPTSAPRAAADDEATRVQPASAPGVDPQATSVTGTTGTTGRTHSTFNADSWKRVADAAGGDYAAVGSVLKGRFHLEKEIGRGGMGVVFLALDERKVEARDRDPYVAVKVLNDEFRRHPDSLIALQREARRSQSLAHDNIVRVYDFDKDGTIVFMTMEYVDGSDLKALIREKAYNGMPLAKARPLIEGMAWALKRAHAAGVVHSDFKPGNVMVTRDGAPKVFDFGIARAGKHLGEATGEETVFDAGTLGALTPAYASLEMIQGKEPTPSDDIYALGCVAFELLTGKHPFDKVSAEVAMREGRKPPPVPGLTKRQYQTLCEAIAFTADKRLKNAADLVEGLREVGLRERLGPYLVFGSLGVVLVGAAGWGAAHYLHQRHVTELVARLAPSNPQHYANEDKAYAALAALGTDERTRLVIDQGDAIEGFLLSRLDGYWNPDKQRYDYARAQHVFALRDQLKLYSPKLDLRRSAIERERNELLNRLDTQLSEAIGKGAIFTGTPDNAVAILDTIRRVDPASSLLKNAELELKYDIAIGQSVAAGDATQAADRLRQAQAVFPGSTRLAQRAAQVQAMAAASAAAAPVAAAGAQSVPQARQALLALAAQPTLDASWQARVSQAMATLAGHDDAATREAIDGLATALAAAVASRSDPLQLPQASQAVDLGLRYAPASAPLLAQRARIQGLQQAIQARLDRESAAAEVTARIESMRRAAAANDVGKAQEAFNRIRALQPDSPFLAGDGPALLSQAYLGQALDAAQRGRYAGAVDTIARATRALGERGELRQARARYTLLADLMTARTQGATPSSQAALRQRLDAVARAAPDDLAQLEAALKLRGQLPQGSLSALLESIRPPVASTPTVPAPAPTPPGVGAPAGAQPGTPPGGAQAPATAPGARPAAAPSPTAPAPATAAATAAARPDDPCGDPALVGSGRLCVDRPGGQRGPALVVVPGVGGGKPYALSRAEVSVSEFNRFCAATGQCKPRAAEDRLSASLPVANIPLAQARAYTAWLSQASGFRYRLPTDAEWLAAAHAGGRWKQAPDSNCVPPTATADDGTGAPISSLGRSPNPWGLVNLTGNVWEWVGSGAAVAVRGASYSSYWSDCTVDAHRADDGQAQPDVGFRVLRELP